MDSVPDGAGARELLTDCIDVGSGFPIVFSHGSMMSHRMFQPQWETLSDEFRIVAYDHRARTKRWQGPYDLYALAADCRALLDALEIRRCILAGMSMGGFMALRFALQWPERIAGLVLIASSGLPYGDEQKATWRSYYAGIRSAKTLPPEFTEEEARGVFSEKTRATRPELIQDWTQRWSCYEGAAVYPEVECWIDQDDIRNRLSEIVVPALFLHGREDSAIPLDEALTTAEMMQSARVEVIGDAGHTLTLEAPDDVSDAVRNFARQVAGESGVP